MKNHVLVTFKDNWADEMDIFGFRVMEKEAWEEYKTQFSDTFDSNGEWTFYCGTNEEIDYGNLDQFLSSFTVKEITDEEASSLLNLFGSTQKGHFPEIG